MTGSKTLLALAFAALFSLPSARLQQEELGAVLFQDEDVSVRLQDEDYLFAIGSDGLRFESFVALAAQLLDHEYAYDSRRLNGQNKVINLVGEAKVKKTDLERFVEELFRAHNMAVFPVSDRPGSVLLIEDIQTSQLLKQHATTVDVAEIDSVCGRHPARIFMAVIPLRHIQPDDCQRALNNMIQEHRAGFVHPVNSASAVVVCNFGDTMVTMHEAVKRLEAAAAIAPKHDDHDHDHDDDDGGEEGR